jgi:hypothetical protein
MARKTTAAGKQPPAKPKAIPDARISVRMYRQGLGDCFLITVSRDGGSAFRILIDCGVILGTTGAGSKLRAVVQDIITTTDDRKQGGFVDVLVVTHEHYDHVSGFVLADDLWSAGGVRAPGKLAIGEVWFAWTEDPKDATANRIRQSRNDRLSALTALAGRVNGMAASASAGVSDALRFFGVDADGNGLGATAQAMQNAAGLAAKDGVRYHRPGDVLHPPGAPELRIFVLGPPVDEKALRKTDAPAEIYHLDIGDLEDTVLRAVAAGTADDLRDQYAPFDTAYTHNLSDAAVAGSGSAGGPLAEFLAQRYFGTTSATPDTDPGWRRIDGDWLNGAEQLALALDSATNNTSLVLAIELAGSGKVLMFPADAQAGNWLSWPDVQFADAAGVTAQDLLNRTVFYKVGHHGSHNATLKQKGLEEMTSPDLVAFIPVDHAMAVKKRWGQMPLPGLIDALKAHCGNRVVRVDEDLPAGFDAVTKGPSHSDIGGPLWYEWTMPR